MKAKKINSSLVVKMYRERYTGPEIAKKFGISKNTVYKKLRKLNVTIRSNSEAQKFRLKFHKIEGRPPNKIKIPASNSEKISEAYVIGVLIGDGYLTKNIARLNVTQRDFMQEFAKCIENAYGIKPYKKEYEEKNLFICTANSVSLSRRIIKLTNNRSKIPSFITNGNKNIKGAFIRGFVDSEGSVDDVYNRHQIVITQKDTKRLETIQNLLLGLFIQSKIYKKSTDQLVISLLRNLKRFKEIVGFSIEYKKQKLEKIINYLEKIDISNLYWRALRKRINSNKSSQKLASELKMKTGTFRSWISGRRIPRQIKKDITYAWIPKDYENLRKHFKFLPKITKQLRHQRP